MRVTARRMHLWSITLTFLACVMTLVFIFPIYWITATSLQDGITASAVPPQFVFAPTLDNYIGLFTEADFGRVMLNTVEITVGTTLLALVLGTPAAYALARFRGLSTPQVSFNILSVRLLPGYVAVIPLFILLQRIHLFGNIFGVIVAGSLGAVSFVIWMMRAFIATIPVELEEAAVIDGCSRLGAVGRITLPLSAAGLVATSVFTAVAVWNEFILVLIIGGEDAKTMPIVLSTLVTAHRAEWGQLAAGGVLTMVPVIVFVLLVRRYFVAGMTAGSVNA
jgi:multiple sugar transport system permease protein